MALPALAQAPAMNGGSNSLTVVRNEPIIELWSHDGFKLHQGPILASQNYVSSVHRIPEVNFPIKTGGWSKCSCLLSVQNWRPDFPRPIGVPNNLAPKEKEPFLGAIIITSEGRVGHAGQVLNFSQLEVTFRECNYSPCSCGIRTLPRGSPLIRGYY